MGRKSEGLVQRLIGVGLFLRQGIQRRRSELISFWSTNPHFLQRVGVLKEGNLEAVLA